MLLKSFGYAVELQYYKIETTIWEAFIMSRTCIRVNVEAA